MSDGPKGEKKDSVILRSMYHGITESMSEQKERSSWGWKRHAVRLAFALWFVCYFVNLNSLFCSKGNLPSGTVVETHWSENLNSATHKIYTLVRLNDLSKPWFPHY